MTCTSPAAAVIQCEVTADPQPALHSLVGVKPCTMPKAGLQTLRSLTSGLTQHTLATDTRPQKHTCRLQSIVRKVCAITALNSRLQKEATARPQERVSRVEISVGYIQPIGPQDHAYALQHACPLLPSSMLVIAERHAFMSRSACLCM